ncbi:MAG: ABC transporter ATP-binding protein [Oscillospiraceae bacterium]|nr:ABC transporter ATP-binding protein [Oscillospiraceae bacterium]MDY3792181.1 ABC transporter ATP-binding protein [Oscillospiraceae bacterium]MDY6208532.1 ABC transporter ATP-binding protein [Oscillospiraceae bacterium]
MVVDVQNVSIRYLLGDFKDIGIKEYLVQKLTGTYEVQEFWAVKNVSFSLNAGDFLGIIGTNGAGKSTLLKAVSGIIKPQKGKIVTNGQIAALLELGTGFDGDLTIKENIYFRGALLGYTEKFMNEKYPEIIEFSELQDFENRKFRQLSSGMRSRLAFSIASLIDPDILILDEVLAVGDGAFRAKSEKKMLEIINSGVTTLFVSHSTAQMRKLCNKVLWLNKGEQMAFGDAKSVCDEYDKFIRAKGNSANKT